MSVRNWMTTSKSLSIPPTIYATLTYFNSILWAHNAMRSSPRSRKPKRPMVIPVGMASGLLKRTSRISHAGELHGISEIGSGRLFIVKPYGLLGFSHFPNSAEGTGLIPGASALATGGLDAKLGLRSNLVANFTVNTDFADADVDTLQ